jgi:SAM-dependent methyltransferase
MLPQPPQEYNLDITLVGGYLQSRVWDQTESRVWHSPQDFPFASESLAAITCRFVTCYIQPIEYLIRECGRVLMPGGYIKIADTIVAEIPKVARYSNLLERLRNPAYQAAYSLPDWEFFLEMAGLEVQVVEPFTETQHLGEWAQDCDNLTLERLRVLLLQAPQPVREWYHLEAQPGLSPYIDIRFEIPGAVILARKRPN